MSWKGLGKWAMTGMGPNDAIRVVWALGKFLSSSFVFLFATNCYNKNKLLF